MAESAVVLEASLQVADLHDVIVRTLQSIDEPVTPAILRSQLPGPYQVSVSDLTQTLQTLTQQGRAHRFAPYRAKSDRFWNRSLRDYAVLLLTSQTVDRFETKSYWVKKFKARLKGISDKDLGDLIQQLVRSGQMHSGRFLGGTSDRFSASPLDARAVLENALDRIANRFSLSPSDVRKLIEPGANSTDQAPAATAEVVETPIQAQSLITEAIHELRPGGGGSIVPIVELRRFLEFKLSREAFDSALRQMERDGQIDFTLHPDPTSLDDSARQDRTLDDRGKIYDMLIVRR